MEYKRFKDKYVIRMDRGEEILETLKEICSQENIKLASIQAIGAVDEFSVGLYDVKEKKYNSNTFKGAYEITSLLGNITMMNGEYYAHLHMSCADKDGHAFGGHLTYARVSATVEMILTLIDGEVDRRKDETTGLNLFKF